MVRIQIQCRMEFQDPALTIGKRISQREKLNLRNTSPVGESDFFFLRAIKPYSLFHSCSSGTAVITMCPKPDLQYVLIYSVCPTVARWLFWEKVIANNERAHIPLLFPSALARLRCSKAELRLIYIITHLETGERELFSNPLPDNSEQFWKFSGQTGC